VEALRELIIDTLFVFNLSELACIFERHFSCSEDTFWQAIYQRLQTYAQQGHCSQQRLDRMPINQREISTESLITKKLADVEEDHFHHTIDNPFAGLPPLSV
jgi:siderophore synthetase component